MNQNAKTFAEKALARASGNTSVSTGQIVDVTPDAVLSHDNTAAIWKLFKQLGVSNVKYPDRLRITLDHAVPAPSTQHAQNHAEVRRFVAEQGVKHAFEVGRGICHQVLSEEALVLPGQTILGADSHTTHYGWMGAFGAGVGRSEVAALWATGELWLRVPEAMQIKLTGKFQPGVTAKDFCLQLIGKLGSDGGLYQSIEFCGDGVTQMSLNDRMTIPNMMAEFGAKNAYLPPDAMVFDYLAARLAKRIGGTTADYWHQLQTQALFADDDAVYHSRHHFDLSTFEPMVAQPHRVDNVVPVSQLKGIRVHQAFIGTCTNGRLEDIAAACEVLRGKKISTGTRLIVIPASSQVMREATALGYVADLLDAGAVVGIPSCGPCMGSHMGVPATGEVTISSANRNFKGRMGTRDSEIYLASPSVVAASALAGEICAP